MASKLLRRTALANIGDLLPHEMISEQTVNLVQKMIASDGAFKVPVLVDSEFGIILDGHHRVEALRRLGIKLAPVYIVDYRSNDILVFSRRKEIIVTKNEVIRRALRGDLYPYKTTRHVVVGGSMPCSLIYLDELRGERAPLPIVSFQRKAFSLG